MVEVEENLTRRIETVRQNISNFMSVLDDLIQEIADKNLRRRIEKEIAILKGTKKFGIILKAEPLTLSRKRMNTRYLSYRTLLNVEDSGNRRCILVTNNEVSDAEEKRLFAAQVTRQMTKNGNWANSLINFISSTRDWSIFPRSTFLQVQYYLTKQRTLLEIERGRLNQIKFSLQNKQVELEALFRQPEVVKKIDEIATGILARIINSSVSQKKSTSATKK